MRHPYRSLLSRPGRPFRSQPAEGPPPASFELSLQEEAQLLHVRRAGIAGTPLGHGLTVTLAIRLQLLGHVVITRTDPQLVLARDAWRRAA